MRIHYDAGLHYRTIYTIVEVLKEAGFVKKHYDEGPSVRRFISLVEKGKEVAEHARKSIYLQRLRNSKLASLA